MFDILSASPFNYISSKNKTMSNDKEFVWTDELVKEFAGYSSIIHVDDKLVSNFKQSKQPKRDWEILSYGVGLPDPIILKVKRISDNEVFSVGDKITDREESRRLEIKSFEIWAHHWLKVKATDNFNYITRNIDTINKCSILFTTEDNVPIYEGDYYYLVTDSLEYKTMTASSSAIYTPAHYFSTREATETYISKHKPKYSEEQLRDCFVQSRFTNPLIGFKYDSFEEYIQSLNK